MAEIIDLTDYRLDTVNAETKKRQLIALLAGKVGAYATIETNPAWAIVPAGDSMRLIRHKGDTRLFEDVYLGGVDQAGVVDFLTGDGRTTDADGVLGYETDLDDISSLEITRQPDPSRRRK